MAKKNKKVKKENIKFKNVRQFLYDLVEIVKKNALKIKLKNDIDLDKRIKLVAYIFYYEFQREGFSYGRMIKELKYLNDYVYNVKFYEYFKYHTIEFLEKELVRLRKIRIMSKNRIAQRKHRGKYQDVSLHSTLTISLDKNLKSEFKEKLLKENITQSEFVIRAIENYLK